MWGFSFDDIARRAQVEAAKLAVRFCCVSHFVIIMLFCSFGSVDSPNKFAPRLPSDPVSSPPPSTPVFFRSQLRPASAVRAFSIWMPCTPTVLLPSLPPPPAPPPPPASPPPSRPPRRRTDAPTTPPVRFTRNPPRRRTGEGAPPPPTTTTTTIGRRRRRRRYPTPRGAGRRCRLLHRGR